jgi:RNA polymerase sigma-70 factor (ECF subfamily)
MPPLDGATFEASYRRIFPLVLAKCRRMLRGHEDAADVAQEVFLRLWKQRDLIQDAQALTAWLYQTSTRLVIDRARRSTLSRESLIYLQTVALGEGELRYEELLESRQDLRMVMADFPANELEAAILNRLDRLTHPEVAEVMGLGERTVRRLLSRFDERASTLRGSAE